ARAAAAAAAAAPGGPWRAPLIPWLGSGGGGGGATDTARAQGPPPCLVHIIERSSPFSGADDPAATGERNVHVVKSPKSGVNFFDLGDFDQQFDAARRRARPALEQLLATGAVPSGAGGGGGGRVRSARGSGSGRRSLAQRSKAQ
ncbi:hypothetical protein MNEG_12396, partial [Monoraphidium neglectum]